MRKKFNRYKFIDVFLGFGFVFLLLCGFGVFTISDKIFDDAFETLLLLQIILGNAVMTFSFAKENRFYQFYTGVILFLWGFFTFIFVKWIPLTIVECWPLYAPLAGFGLIGAGLYRYKKWKLGFVFPAVVLICLGLWYSLFSFGVIHMSFTVANLIFGPILIVSLIVFMMLIIFAQKKNKNLIIEDEDDSDVFEDDSLPFREVDED